MNRADLMHSVLKDGTWHTRRDVFQRVGFFLTNNAASELRARGFDVEHRRSGRIDEYRILADGPSHSPAHRSAVPPQAVAASSLTAITDEAPSAEQLELIVAA